MYPGSKAEADELLRNLGAPARLIKHVELVSEAVRPILDCLRHRGVQGDWELVRIGIILHDVGKILFPHELLEPGHAHETAGEQMLLRAGVSACLARVCVLHARWDTMECSLEELLIPLADKLWKGVRVQDLEKRVIDRVAQQLNQDFWDTFIELDNCFESVAARAPERLERSRDS